MVENISLICYGTLSLVGVAGGVWIVASSYFSWLFLFLVLYLVFFLFLFYYFYSTLLFLFVSAKKYLINIFQRYMLNITSLTSPFLIFII